MPPENAAKVLPQYVFPQIGVEVVPDPQGKRFLALTFSTPTTRHQFFLAYSKDYAEAADQIYKGIMKAGADLKRSERGIVVANAGDLNGLRQPPGS